MTVISFSDRVRALGLPLDKVIVIASGVLDTYGIRQASDIDLAVAPDVFASLESAEGWTKYQAEWGETYYRNGDAEVWSGWTEPESEHPTYEELLPDTVEIDGIRYMTLEYVRKWKQAKRRDKDLRDIALIDAHNAQET